MEAKKKEYRAEMEKSYKPGGYADILPTITQEEVVHHRTNFQLIDINGDGCIERHEAVSEIARKMRSLKGNAPPAKDSGKDAVLEAAEREVNSMFDKMDSRFYVHWPLFHLGSPRISRLCVQSVAKK